MVQGKVCVVTGGGRGIGKTIVETFASNGAAAVYALDISEDSLASLSGDSIHGEVVNVLDSASIRTVVEKIITAHGRIDVLVNNAGITRDAVINKMDDEAWQAVIDVNLKGVFLMTREIGPRMMEHGSGSIVNISSVVGLDGNMGQTNYAASKAGIIGFSKSLAKELGSRGVTVNVVAPGFVKTDMTDELNEKAQQAMKDAVPLGHPAEPEDVANAVAFLASPAADYITGHVLHVDGGLAM